MVDRWIEHREPDTYFLRLDEGADPRRVRRYLKEASHDDLNVVLVDEVLPDEVVYLQAAIYVLSAILIGIALINVFNTSLLATRENVRVLGVLKTVGMTPVQVMAMVNITAGCLGLLATAAGVPLGLFLTKRLLASLALSYGFGRMHVTFDPLLGVLLLPGMVLVSMVGSFVPGLRAARLSIVKVLQGE
jgi:putative ABC transport system permease protein